MQQTQSTKTVHKLSPRVMKALAHSEELKLDGKHATALEIAEKILMEDPGCTEAAEEVADNLLSLNKPKEAKKAAEHVLKLDKNSYIANFVMGFVLSEQEKWKDAIEFFNKSNDGQPNNPEILRCLGWALFQENKQAEGIAILRRALFLRNNDPAILCDLGACLLQQNNFTEGVSLLRRAQGLDPNDPRVLELLTLGERLQKAYLHHT